MRDLERVKRYHRQFCPCCEHFYYSDADIAAYVRKYPPSQLHADFAVYDAS